MVYRFYYELGDCNINDYKIFAIQPEKSRGKKTFA